MHDTSYETTITTSLTTSLMYSKALGFVNWKPLTALAYAMKPSTVASPWLLLLCLAAATTAGAHQARAQPDINGKLKVPRKAIAQCN